MDIKDFAKQNQNTEKPEQSKKNEKDVSKELANEFLKRYGKMSREQMLAEMFELVKKKKEQGTFDFEQIEKATHAIAPFLSHEQRDYMQSLLNSLK